MCVCNLSALVSISFKFLLPASVLFCLLLFPRSLTRSLSHSSLILRLFLQIHSFDTALARCARNAALSFLFLFRLLLAVVYFDMFFSCWFPRNPCPFCHRVSLIFYIHTPSPLPRSTHTFPILGCVACSVPQCLPCLHPNPPPPTLSLFQPN
ncbi:hypothetical protein DFJ73DRAFT_52369 [Zopfochytrium polystomum]|nr:hypothetical protein DFJ73DRAFT_52369 [Zopfochytrium polystomum]